jgi:hypothetical protein
MSRDSQSSGGRREKCRKRKNRLREVKNLVEKATKRGVEKIGGGAKIFLT